MVQQEEPGQAELVDQLQLLVEAGPGVALVPVGPGVAHVERAAADLGELRDGRLRLVREVRVAVAQLLRQVELAALGDHGGALDCVPVEREAVGDLGGMPEDRLVVSAPLRLGASSDVWRIATSASWSSARPGSWAWTSPVTTVSTSSVSASSRSRALRRTSPRSKGRWSSTKNRSRPKARARRGGGIRVLDGEPEARAAGEADEPFVQLFEQLLVERRLECGLALLRPVRVRRGQQAAEIRVAARALDEQRDVRAVAERHLGPGDRPDAERLRRMRELERAVDAVVVGERERLVAELRRPHRQLLGQRAPSRNE